MRLQLTYRPFGTYHNYSKDCWASFEGALRYEIAKGYLDSLLIEEIVHLKDDDDVAGGDSDDSDILDPREWWGWVRVHVPVEVHKRALYAIQQRYQGAEGGCDIIDDSSTVPAPQGEPGPDFRWEDGDLVTEVEAEVEIGTVEGGNPPALAQLDLQDERPMVVGCEDGEIGIEVLDDE